MVESDFQTEFTKWMKYNLPFSFAYEIKKNKKGEKSIGFAQFEPQQLPSLVLAKHGEGGVRYKFPDDSRGTKPFDGCKLYQVPAFVVLYFYKHGQKEFVMIDIDIFMSEIETCGRKSITEERAKEIGSVYEIGQIY